MGYSHHDQISVENGYAVGKAGEEELIINGDGTFTEKWIDISFSATQTKTGANLKPDFDETNVGLLFPQNDATEKVYAIGIVNHDWKEGTTIYPHVHWRQSANQTPVFKVDYKWYNEGETVPANFTTYTMSTKVKTYTSGTISQISTNTTGIDGTGKTFASILLMKLYRDDNAYTGDVLVDRFDIHIQVNTLGTKTQF